MPQIEVVSEISGNVWLVETKAGDTVKEDDTLIVIESMKMEIPVDAPTTGKILRILVNKDDAVSENQVIALMKIK